VIPHRVPVLLRPVVRRIQRRRPRVEARRIEVREVPALVVVPVEAVEQLDGLLDVIHDPRVAGDPVRLRGPGQRVDLLVGRYRAPVIAEGRPEQLLLPSIGKHPQPVIPVHHALLRVILPQVLAQVVGALLGGLEEPVLSRQEVCRGHAEHHARDGIGLLQVVGLLRPRQMQARPVVAVVDGLLRIAKLPPDVAVGDVRYLLDPPVRLLEPVCARRVAGEDDGLDLELGPSLVGVEDAVGVEVLPGHEHLAHLAATVPIALAQVLRDPGERGGGQAAPKLAAIAGPEPYKPLLSVVARDVTGNGIRKREVRFGHTRSRAPC